MSDDILARVAVLESTIREVIPMFDRVTTLEADMRHLSTDITEMKETQTNGIKERQQQYEKLTTLINENHTVALSKIQASCQYNDERLIRTFHPVKESLDSINTSFKAAVFIFGDIGSIIALVVGIISVWPG